ncbi:MAG: efflux RND transporter periplasmic adaptor subunit [Candidatus Jettenia sp.]|uniref:Putative transporter protein n=1 Tax=Candidatus Jettenia caeni TaxID=247490 RepID=I3ILL5_9BACT|nr:efflux RND transporter periplasmic adaptor subunit [Candidatus Jettenia sp. AMX1]MBC6927365.1 efflux RND transporter periplasmic adaptor subunit [Candidatus Jettenia sp.]WKZ14430.1 MAG: efflux RND transporter periplasmic adaptor subunit [Candidatus Jettenia caeni]KAA0251741.1 MAG: efflux RND transporter periplasmic adaptor subunit [Candidatus Jettenia sp. AMX1]MCE7879048.1 efflux RND transporter periplasmic adaptor subunit [Candidatus Jettenia sp. AMX1]MCQ3925794.1 efflux RND transporter pe
MKPFLVTKFCFVLGCTAVVAACSPGTMEKAGIPNGVPVTAAIAVQKDVPVQMSAIGNVEAYSTVSVKTQVEGELLRVCFQEGQEVEKGDLLFIIDPRPFKALQRQFEANLARDSALMNKAETDAGRYEELFKNGIVSQQEYDQYRTNFEALKETVRADAAAVVNAKLQVGYCYIRSPINGRVGKLFVNQGNVVKANDTVLVTINQTKPIYVTFHLPEQKLLKIRKYMALGNVKVEAILPQNEIKPVIGELTFINNEVNNSAGTIFLRAVFANTEEFLWPKQFVHVAITLTMQRNAVVVPAQAIQTGQEGKYVFIIKSDLTIEYRPVIPGTGFDQEIIVVKGVQPGEKVVTNGQLQLTSGSKVEIKNDSGRWAQKASGLNDQEMVTYE